MWQRMFYETSLASEGRTRSRELEAHYEPLSRFQTGAAFPPRRRMQMQRQQTWHTELDEMEGQPSSPINPQLVRNKFVIEPSNRCFHSWDILMVVTLIFTAIIAPYESAFVSDSHMGASFIFDRTVDLIFSADMCLQFFIAYPNPRNPERLVKAHRKIIWNYLTGWFVPDLASLTPAVIYIASYIKGERIRYGLLTFEVLRVIRLARLLRLLRFTKIFDRWSTSFGFSYASLSLMKFFTLVIFCCHWTACLWGGCALYLDRAGEVNWLAALRAEKLGEETAFAEPHKIYGLSLYWAIISLTSIGYGDIVPQGGYEYFIAAFCTCVMASTWAYVIGSVCTIVSTLQPHDIFFKRTMDDLNWLLASHNCSTRMRQTLRRYFHEAREMNKQKVEESVIQQMSPMLQGQFSMFLHQRWIQKVWYLEDMNREIIVWAARNLTLMIYAPGEDILDERTLFIVRRGMSAHRGRILTSGDIWGEDMLLSNDVLRDRNNARALSYLSVLRLRIGDLFDVVVSFPEAKIRLRWAQVKIATVRGVSLLAKTLQSLRVRGLMNIDNLEEEARLRLYKDILVGAFDEEETQKYFESGSEGEGTSSVMTDHMVLDVRANARMVRSRTSSSGLPERSPKPAGRQTRAVLESLVPNGRKYEYQNTEQSGTSMTNLMTINDGTGSIGPQMTHLVQSMDALKVQVSLLGQKVDSIVNETVPHVTPLRTSSWHTHTSRASSTSRPGCSMGRDSTFDIDFGPLCMDTTRDKKRKKTQENKGRAPASMGRTRSTRRLDTSEGRRASWYDILPEV